MGIILDISEVSPRTVIVSPGKNKDAPCLPWGSRVSQTQPVTLNSIPNSAASGFSFDFALVFTFVFSSIFFIKKKQIKTCSSLT